MLSRISIRCKYIFFRLMPLAIPLGIGVNAYSEDNFDYLILKNKEIGSDIFTSHYYRPGNVKHIVMFKYKPSVTQKQKEEVIRRFLELQQSTRKRKKHPYIISITTGSQSSGEKHGLGFEQAFIVTFSSEGDRNYYVGTPIVSNQKYYDKSHDEFKKFVGPLLSDNNGILVFDFTDNRCKVSYNE